MSIISLGQQTNKTIFSSHNFVVLQVKFGLSITSSEKADKEKRYCDFDLYSVPYPGM